MTVSVGVAAERPTPWLSGCLIVLLGSVGFFGYGGPLGYMLPLSTMGWLLAPLVLRPRVPAAEWWVLAAIAAWAAISMAWSPAAPNTAVEGYGDLESLTALKLPLQLAWYGVVVVAAAGVSAGGARRALQAMTLFVAPWSFLVLLDGLTGGRAWWAITGVVGVETPPHLLVKKAAEGAYVLAVLIWPVLGFLVRRGRPYLAASMLTAAMVGMAALSAWSAVVAVLAGGAALLLVRFGGYIGGRALGYVTSMATAATLLVLLAAGDGLASARDQLAASWAARVDIWRFAADLIGQHPFRGWGIDASRTVGPGIPLHPHNATLQLWLELGAVGVLLAGAFWLLLGRRVAALAEDRPEAAQIAGATLAAYYTVGALSFGVWQEWWLAVGGIAVVACTVFARSPPEARPGLTEITA